ncbi:hypothetical protein [Romboutsia sp. 13368]|uniref:hypothetical protein n=1 Tax=Romboutsia sp. 13368 TaxID=2708053 RepID=UPI0025E8F466|nr:hypothetical protein [Romboutsia sp. 13368]
MIMFIIFISLFTIAMIYFVSMVCIQFNYINNINLQFGMDINTLYSDECDEGFLGYINTLIRNSAMNLYKIHNYFNKRIRHRY